MQVLPGAFSYFRSEDSSLTLRSKYAVGDEFYRNLSISFDTRWRDLGILICYTVFNGIVVRSLPPHIFEGSR